MRVPIPPPRRSVGASAVALFHQAQAGRRDSLNRLMAEHDVIRPDIIGGDVAVR